MSTVLRTARYTLPDPTFSAWAQGSLLWLADKGMGYLPVTGEPYDDDYFDRYVQYAKTALGRRLTVARIEMIQRHVRVTPEHTLIDVGVGCGDFIERASETWSTELYGYDVNRAAVEWLTDRGLYRDPRSAPFDIATFFDSLEHVSDAYRIIENVKSWVFCSLPIVPGDGPPARGWKHLRPTEHVWYWTRDGLIGWMRDQGFVCTEHGTPESIAGRLDIHSFAFRRLE